MKKKIIRQAEELRYETEILILSTSGLTVISGEVDVLIGTADAAFVRRSAPPLGLPSTTDYTMRNIDEIKNSFPYSLGS